MVIEPVEFNSKTRMTDIGEVPTDWEVKPIKEVAIIVSGGTPSKSNSSYWENGSIAWATPTDITRNKNKYITNTELKITESGLKGSSANLLPINSILMTSRATIGASSIAKVPIATNQGFKSFICKENLWYEYLYYYLEVLKPYFIANASGSTFLEISKGATENQLIAVPSIKEQQKIAEILSAADEQIEKTKQLIEKTKGLKKGLMSQLLTKGIGHSSFKQTTMGEIPETWKLIKLGETKNQNDRYSFAGGPFGSDLTSKEYTKTGVQIIQLQNILEGKFNNNHRIFTSEEKADELRKCNIYPGEIVIAKMAEPVARATIVPNHDERLLMASDAIRLSPDKEKYDPHFLMYAINSPYFRKQAIINSTGTTRLRIGLTSLANLIFLMPPLEEQKKITNVLSSVDNQIETYEKEKKKQIELKKALMQQLLTGKLRVTV